MQSPRQYTLMFLLVAALGFAEARITFAADDGDDPRKVATTAPRAASSAPRRATDVETVPIGSTPNAARTISRRFDLASDSASQAADAVIVQASEVLERTAQSGDASEADLVIELR